MYILVDDTLIIIILEKSRNAGEAKQVKWRVDWSEGRVELSPGNYFTTAERKCRSESSGIFFLQFYQ